MVKHRTIGTIVTENTAIRFDRYARSLNETTSSLLRKWVHEALAGQERARTPRELARDIAIMSDSLRRSLTD